MSVAGIDCIGRLLYLVGINPFQMLKILNLFLERMEQNGLSLVSNKI